MAKKIKLISWNVNGIRAVLKKGFEKFVDSESPDMICLQEVKAKPEQVELKIKEYSSFWNAANRPGYSGTLILSKIAPISVKCGFGMKEHDGEGRVLTAEYEHFYLVNVYVPNSKRDLSRLDYRQKWDRDFLSFVKKLEKKKPVVFCGDLNVAYQEIDLTNPKANRRNHGFTDEERAGFQAFVDAGFIDTFRRFHKGPNHYTWWSQLNNCRSRNIGWRIDYFCVSRALKGKLKNASILSKVKGSDHCPVSLELNL